MALSSTIPGRCLDQPRASAKRAPDRDDERADHEPEHKDRDHTEADAGVATVGRIQERILIPAGKGPRTRVWATLGTGTRWNNRGVLATERIATTEPCIWPV